VVAIGESVSKSSTQLTHIEEQIKQLKLSAHISTNQVENITDITALRSAFVALHVRCEAAEAERTDLLRTLGQPRARNLSPIRIAAPMSNMSVRCKPFTSTRRPDYYPDFAKWLSTFELHARGATECEKLPVLRLHLTEQAQWFYESLPGRIEYDYALLVDEFSKCYPPEFTASQALEEFYTRRQRSGESVDEFAAALRHLLAMARPRLGGGECVDALLHTRLTKGSFSHLHGR
jgi:hypothetical protein